VERNLFLLTFLYGIVLGSDAFWFSYRSVTLNHALIYEEKNISPLTIPFSGKKTFACRVKIKKSTHISILKSLNDNFYKILPCFYSSVAKVTSQSKTTLKGSRDEVELIIVPTRFTVDFKDDFANISILK